LKLFFIFGYLDGDGSIAEVKEDLDLIGYSKIEIIGNFSLLLSIHYYLKNTYNISSTITKHKKTKYSINIRHYNDLNLLFLEYLKYPYILERKRKRAVSWCEKFERYNIRKIKIPNSCKCCGKEIGNSSTYCIECGHIIERKVERPSREVLKEEIRTNSFLALSKKYGVSDNTIRKWCKYYKLPYKVTEIKKISDEDWVII